MKKTLLLLSAFVASLVTFAQTNLTSGKTVYPLGKLKSYNNGTADYTISNEDLQKITKDGNTDNVFLFPEGGYDTEANIAVGIQGFYIDLGEAKSIGAIKSTWEGADAEGNIYVTDNEPAADGTLKGETLIGAFTKAQELAKDIAVSVANSGRYVVFVPTDATQYAWGVKIRTFVALEKETSVLTSLEVTPAFVLAGVATEMNIVAKDQFGAEMTEGVSYTAGGATTWADNMLTADEMVTFTATCNAVSVSKNIAVFNGIPTEPNTDADNVLVVYSSKYDKEELTVSGPTYGGYYGSTGNKLYETFTYVELPAEGNIVHKVVHVKGTGINSRTLNDESAAGYNKFHAAIYPTTATSAFIFKDDGYADRVSITGLIPGQWNYVETIVDFDNFYVTIALDGETEFYVDHIYFEKVENMEETGSFTIADACTDGEKYYGTYYTDKAYVMPEGVEGQIVSVDNNNKLVVKTVYAVGAVVPANTPLLMCASKPGHYLYTVTTEDGQTYEDNMLHRGDHTGWDTDGTYYFYRLTMHEGQIGFWWGAADGAWFNPGANKAYLAVPVQEETTYLVRGFSFNGEATDISNVKAEAAGEDVIYDLSGRRVLSPVKAGIYIVNGKKMVIK